MAAADSCQANGIFMNAAEDGAAISNGTSPVSPSSGSGALALSSGEFAGTQMLAPRLLQQRLREAADKVDRVIQDTRVVTHQAYAQLEAQEDRLTPLTGRLADRLDAGAQLQSAQISNGDGPSNAHGKSLEETLQSSLVQLSSAQRCDLADSIGVLEQEMAHLVNLAAGGEEAAAKVARTRESLMGLCTQLGALRETGIGARALGPKASTNALSLQDARKLEATVGQLWTKVSELAATGGRTSAEFADMQEQFSNIREAMLALHSHVALRDDVQRALTLLREEFLGQPAIEDLRAGDVLQSASAEPSADITPEQDLTHAGNALQEEWAQLLDLGLARLHAESDPNSSATREADSPSPPSARQLSRLQAEDTTNASSEKFLEGMRQEFAGALASMQKELAQVSMRCDQAVGHARETSRDVDRLRDELRDELALRAPAQRFATKHEISELSEHLRGCEASLRQELRDVQEQTMQRPRPADQEARHRGVSHEDLAEVTEQLRRESMELISQKRDGESMVSKQELGRNVGSIWEELQQLADRVGNNEKTCEDLGDPRKDIKRLFEQLNILKDKHEVTGDQAKAGMDAVEHRLHSQHQELSGSLSELEAKLAQDLVPKDEFKGAIHAVMDELIQAQKLGMGTREDLDTLAKAVETLRMRNSLLGEEVKKRMDVLDGGVQSLKEDLVVAIAEIRRRASKEEGPKPRAADAALLAKAASEPVPGKETQRDSLSPLLEGKLEKFRKEVTEAHALLKEEVLELREKVWADIDGLRKEVRLGAKQTASRQEVLDVADMLRQELKVFADRVEGLSEELHSPQRHHPHPNRPEEMQMSLQSLREELKAEIGQIRELENARRDAKSDSSALQSLEDSRQAVGTSMESIREAVVTASQESRAARRDCVDLREAVNVLSARIITDRSMVTAGVAAAMAMSDRNPVPQNLHSEPTERAAYVTQSQPQLAESAEEAAEKAAAERVAAEKAAAEKTAERAEAERAAADKAAAEKVAAEKAVAEKAASDKVAAEKAAAERAAAEKAASDKAAAGTTSEEKAASEKASLGKAANQAAKAEEDSSGEEESDEEDTKAVAGKSVTEKGEAQEDKVSSVTTQITEKTSAGTTVVSVADTTGFAVGDPIVIGSSAGTEVNEVAGFSSIRLRYPTKYDHPVGTTLRKLLPGDSQRQAWSSIFDEACAGKTGLNASTFHAALTMIHRQYTPGQTSAIFKGYCSGTDRSTLDLPGFCGIVEGCAIGDKAAAEFADVNLETFLSLGKSGAAEEQKSAADAKTEVKSAADDKTQAAPAPAPAPAKAAAGAAKPEKEKEEEDEEEDEEESEEEDGTASQYSSDDVAAKKVDVTKGTEDKVQAEGRPKADSQSTQFDSDKEQKEAEDPKPAASEGAGLLQESPVIETAAEENTGPQAAEDMSAESPTSKSRRSSGFSKLAKSVGQKLRRSLT